MLQLAAASIGGGGGTSSSGSSSIRSASTSKTNTGSTVLLFLISVLVTVLAFASAVGLETVVLLALVVSTSAPGFEINTLTVDVPQFPSYCQFICHPDTSRNNPKRQENYNARRCVGYTGCEPKRMSQCICKG